MDDNKKKALNAALSQIEKQFGKGAVMRMGDAKQFGCPLCVVMEEFIEIPHAIKKQCIGVFCFYPQILTHHRGDGGAFGRGTHVGYCIEGVWLESYKARHALPAESRWQLFIMNRVDNDTLVR